MLQPFPAHITVGRLRELVAEALTSSDSPTLDALILIETATALSRTHLLAEFRTPVTAVTNEAALQVLASLVEQRRGGVSIAYITGVKEFYGYEFSVGPGALVPRPESEHLVEEGLRLLGDYPHALIHDCCTGTGCVGISLARERAARGHTTDLVLSDLEPTALTWTERNARRLLDATGEVHYSVEQRDLLKPVSSSFEDPDDGYDLITANPPYLTTAEMQETALLRWTEPISALDGGTDGLALYPELASQAFARLRPERYLVAEHGSIQGAAVRALFVDAGFKSVETASDLAGRDRLVRARRPADNS